MIRGKVKLYLLLVLLAVSSRCIAQPPVAPSNTGGLFYNPDLRQEKINDPALADFPIAPGWPLALPGSVTGTPVVADLDGDEELEIIVPCMAPLTAQLAMFNSAPSTDAQLWAFKVDGSVVKNWPIVLVPTAERKLAQKSNPVDFDEWNSSPSVLRRLDRDDVVVTVPDAGEWRRRVWRVSGRGAMTKLSVHSDPWASPPLADIDGNGVMDVVLHRTLTSVDAEPIPGWPEQRTIPGGWAPAIGDANGDGKPEVYHPDYAMSYHEKPPKPQGTISGFDSTGQPLPGWPIKVAGNAMYVVMGDVNGDEKMEVCASDALGQIFLWTWDGQPAPATSTQGPWQAVFKTGFSGRYTPLTLADLNGDGKAEIIYFDPQSHALMAWQGDGAGLVDATGVVCLLPEVRGHYDAGVTVADLGGDGVMDLFCGTFWVKLAPDGKSEVKALLPRPGTISSHVTICDVEGDGEGELLFGLVDGRVYLYQTGMSIQAQGLQWPTQNGNFQHTGAWSNPQTIPRN